LHVLSRPLKINQIKKIGGYMKKYTFFITLLIISLILSASSYAAFNNSIKSVNSFDLMQDDWDSIIRPMYYDGLKGKKVVAGLDSVWSGQSLYMGTGLDLFGMKETLAVRYSEGTSESLDTDTTTAYSRGGTVYTQSIVTTSADTIDTSEAAQSTMLDLHLGFGMSMGTMDLGIGIRIGSKNSDQEVDQTDTAATTITNSYVSVQGQKTDRIATDKNSDSDLGIMVGLIAGAIRAQVEFTMLGRKGDGSLMEETKTDTYWSTRVQRVQTEKHVGDYNQASAAITGSDEYNLLNDRDIALTGSTFGVILEMVMSDLIQPGASVFLTSYGVDDDEKEITKTTTDATWYDNATHRQNLDMTDQEVITYDISSLSMMALMIYNDSVFKIADDVTFAMRLEFGLNTEKKDFTITYAETITTKQDTNDDGALEVNTVQVDSGQQNTYLQEISQMVIGLPIFTEVGVAKGVSLRVGSKLTYTKTSTDTTTTRLSSTTTRDFTDNITPANSYAARKQNYTETKTATEDSVTAVAKELQLGIGWDVSDTFSIDTLSRLTPGNGVLVISEWFVSGTARF
jgi:hypothetical protein